MASRKKIMIAAITGAMATAMLTGGASLAFLKDQSDTVTNNFKTNQVLVELNETGDQQYNIIPGTEEAKDPKVTVTNTVDAYLFVTITDKTDDLVTYAIADGWTALEGKDGVFYREVAADATDKEFAVLKDNKVSYGNDITNADMEGKENLKLSFDAFAIQKEGFATAADAYAMAPTKVSNQEELNAALNNAQSGDVIQLAPGNYQLPADTKGVNIIGENAEDTKVDASAWFNTNANHPVDADIKNVTFVQPEGKDRIVKGGIKGHFENCIFDNGNKFASMYGVIQAGDLTFDNCKFKANAYACNFSSTKNNLVFNNCEFTGWNSYGAGGKVSFNNCTFNKSNSYGAVRLYQDAEFNNCTFNFPANDEDAFVDANNSNITITFTNCTGLSENQIFDNTNYPDGYVPDNITWIVDGVTLSRRPKH